MEIVVKFKDINNGEDFDIEVTFNDFVPGEYVVYHENSGFADMERCSNETEIMNVIVGFLEYHINYRIDDYDSPVFESSLNDYMNGIRIARTTKDIYTTFEFSCVDNSAPSTSATVEEQIADTTQQITNLVAKLQELQNQRKATS